MKILTGFSLGRSSKYPTWKIDHMDLLNVLRSSVGTEGLEALAGQFGLDSASAGQILDQLVPPLGKGVQQNVRTPNGLDSLVGALQKGGHQRYLDELSSVVSEEGITDGNNILGHILGSKDASRNVAAEAAKSSGVNPDIIKQMLPMVATMFMGALSKQSDGGTKLAQQSGSGLGDMLSSMLDRDGDGSPVDDVLDMAKKLF